VTPRQALDGRALSVHAAARLAGISLGALHAWLHADVEPDPRALGPLGELVRLSPARQLELLGWLPAELRSSPTATGGWPR
jgi:hypothetical protein